MREIKFRAWFTRDETYVKPMTIQNMIHQKVSNLSLSVLYNECVFEEFTGLKDKNGVEIYENDIVQVRSHLYKDHLGAIIWSQGTAGFCISDNTNKFNIPRPLGIQMDRFLSYEAV